MTRLALVMALAAAPAMAQEIDIRFTPEATEACLAGATGYARLDCAGGSASTCINATSDAYTTVGMSMCLRRELDYWDARLNAAYTTVMQAAEGIDAEMKELGSAAPPQAPALLAMERAWIAYRDAACDYEVTTWGGGTGGGPASVECAMRLTAAQALALEDRSAMN